MKPVRIKRLVERPDEESHLLLVEEERDGVQFGVCLSDQEAHCIHNEMLRASGEPSCSCSGVSLLNLVDVLLSGSEKRIASVMLSGSRTGIRAFVALNGATVKERFVPMHAPSAVALAVRRSVPLVATDSLLESAKDWKVKNSDAQA